MTLALSDRNIALVNSLHQTTRKLAIDFNFLKFFAEPDYAWACLSRFEHSGHPELSTLASLTAESLADREAFETTAPMALPDQPPEVALRVARRATHAKELMNGLAVDAAGLRSYLFVLRLERSRGADDLIALLPTFERLIARRIGPAQAHRVAREVRRLL